MCRSDGEDHRGRERGGEFDEAQARRLRANARPCPTCGRWWDMKGAGIDYEEKCPRGHHRPRPVERSYPLAPAPSATRTDADAERPGLPYLRESGPLRAWRVR
ncbi:hypothetical protein [Glycomyces sp. MUSA5-2]|uniref:hypothetical protein n=1 Tax=Glycomyces sp. MUSA5-2 TaxID=2053002 RepID=UPI0030095772